MIVPLSWQELESQITYICTLQEMGIENRKVANTPTYIHNWPLQPFSHNYGLASHTPHVVCFNFIRERRDLQFNADSQRQIFEKLFHCRFIYSQSFWQKSAERKSPKKYFSYFIFDDWSGIRTQAFVKSNKPAHYILDHDDFLPVRSNF